MTLIQSRANPRPVEVPAEVREFLSTKGNVLLVKGTAGAGKTTFALEALRVLADPERAVYLSSRTSEVMLPRHFPWIGPEWRQRVVDASRLLVEALGGGDGNGNGDAKEPLVRLRRFVGGELASRLTPSDMARLADEPAGIGMGNLVVLDSLEGLAEPLRRDPAELFHDLREIAVEEYDANVIVVLEASGPTQLDYLADGIVELGKERYGNTMLRKLHLEKLRGVTIDNPTYVYTLHEGRFRAFGPDRGGRVPPRAVVTAADPHRVGTGVEGLDEALAGGYEWGSTVLLEAAEDMDDRLLDWLVHGPLTGALRRGHVAYLYPTLGQDAASAHRVVRRHLGPVDAEDRLRIASYVTPGAPEPEPYELPLRVEAGGLGDLPAHYGDVFGWLDGRTNEERRAVLAVSWDHAELQYDVRELDLVAAQAINQVSARGWLLLLFRKRDRDRPRDNLPKLVDTHLRLDTVDRVPVLTVERPYVGTFGLDEDDGSVDVVPFK